MIPMSLRTVADAIDGMLSAGGEVAIQRVTTDSRDVRPGDLFFAIRGDRFDGHDFIAEAAAAGAAACVCSQAWQTSQRAGRSGASAVGRVSPSSSSEDEACSPLDALVRLVVVDAPLAALGRLASYYRRHVMPSTTRVIAITGTNGKTTTKAMLHHVLSGTLRGRAAHKSFNNELGVPLTLLSAEQEDQYLVVEIGTNAPGEVAALASIASPDVAVITSVGESHLEGLGSIEGVVAEKASLLEYLRDDGLAVVNVDHPALVQYLKTRGLLNPAQSGRQSVNASALVTIGHSSAAQIRVTDCDGDLDRTRATLDITAGMVNDVHDSPAGRLPVGRLAIEIPIPGDHQATNAAAAIAAAARLAVPIERSVARLRSLPSLEGRARVQRFGGITVVDDAYNANPVSMIAAVATLACATADRRVFVMGDMLELGSDGLHYHLRAIRAALDAGLDVLICAGPTLREAVARTNCGGRPTVVTCQDAGEASAAALALLRAGDVVWVKGSRAIGLERVVHDLCARFDTVAPCEGAAGKDRSADRCPGPSATLRTADLTRYLTSGL